MNHIITLWDDRYDFFLSAVLPEKKKRTHQHLWKNFENFSLFFILLLFLIAIHRHLNISMSPCYKNWDDNAQSLVMMNMNERLSFNMKTDLFMTGLCTGQACLLSRLKHFPLRNASFCLEAGLCISNSNLFQLIANPLSKNSDKQQSSST